MTSFIGRITAPLSALLLVGALVGCSAATSSTPSPVFEEGRSITSPKGDFTAEEKDGKAFVYPIIENKDGTSLWEDVERYLMAARPVGVAWQKEADILRLLSTDLGNANVAQIQDGARVKDSGAPCPPTSIGSPRATTTRYCEYRLPTAQSTRGERGRDGVRLLVAGHLYVAAKKTTTRSSFAASGFVAPKALSTTRSRAAWAFNRGGSMASGL